MPCLMTFTRSRDFQLLTEQVSPQRQSGMRLRRPRHSQGSLASQHWKLQSEHSLSVSLPTLWWSSNLKAFGQVKLSSIHLQIVYTARHKEQVTARVRDMEPLTHLDQSLR